MNAEIYELDITTVLDILKFYIKSKYTTNKEAAEAFNVSPQFLCDVLHGRKPPPKAILRLIGVRVRTCKKYYIES
jgi:hypothetical protein